MNDDIVYCASTNKAGAGCRMRPRSGDRFCYVHSPVVVEERRAANKRGGTVRGARAALAAAKTNAIAKYGLDELPDLDDVASIQKFIAAIVAGVAGRRISSAQGNTLLQAARLAKDLAGLKLDVLLAEQLTGGKS
jgi:hypothetical protein